MALGSTRAPIDLVEALPNLWWHTLAKVDLPGSILLDQYNRRELDRCGRCPHLSALAFEADLELVLACDELSEYEATQSLIVFSLPIRKARPEELRIEELEPLMGSESASRFLLRHLLHAIRPEERVDSSARRLEPSGRRPALARGEQEGG